MRRAEFSSGGLSKVLILIFVSFALLFRTAAGLRITNANLDVVPGSSFDLKWTGEDFTVNVQVENVTVTAGNTFKPFYRFDVGCPISLDHCKFKVPNLKNGSYVFQLTDSSTTIYSDVWTIGDVPKTPTSTTSSSAALTTTTTGASTTSSQPSSSGGSHKKGLSKGAIAGIAIAGAIVLIGVLALLGWVIFKRGQRSVTKTDGSSSTQPPTMEYSQTLPSPPLPPGHSGAVTSSYNPSERSINHGHELHTNPLTATERSTTNELHTNPASEGFMTQGHELHTDPMNSSNASRHRMSELESSPSTFQGQTTYQSSLTSPPMSATGNVPYGPPADLSSGWRPSGGEQQQYQYQSQHANPVDSRGGQNYAYR